MHDDNGLTPALCAQRRERFQQRISLREWIVSATLILLMVLALVLLTGCGQQTDTPVAQQTDQMAATPVATDQNAASQGSQVNVYLLNTTADGGLPDAGTITVEAGAQPSIATDSKSSAADNSSKDAKGGYVISGVTINVTTGDTTPSLTGTATGTGSASQSPAQTVSAYPVQDIRPETSASIPIGVAMPGGMVDQQAIATGKGQTSGTEKTSENQLTYTQLRAMHDQIGKLLEQLKPPAIPTTQPAKTEPDTGNPATGG